MSSRLYEHDVFCPLAKILPVTGRIIKANLGRPKEDARKPCPVQKPVNRLM